VSQFFHAVGIFFHHLTAIHWAALGLAVLFHLVRIVLRTVAWRNILAASYPDTKVRWRSAFGAYIAGIGVNSLTPARGGDFLKMFLVKRRIEDSSYPTLGATLVVETLFDFVVASALLGWALTLGVLPGLNVLPHLPSIDWSWPVSHPRAAAIIGGILAVGLLVLGIWAAQRVAAFKQRVAQGFAILRDRPRFVRRVVLPQALSWVLRLASTFYFMRAFGLQPSIHDALLVQVAQSLSTVLPISPGGAGTQQGLLVYLFRGHGISTSALLSFSVGMNIVLTVVNALLGFAAIGVMLKTFHWRDSVEPEKRLAES
jgi:uncharacterized membrane protein YbhN (UPF0104 family)